MYTKEEISLIKKELTYNLKSDYGPSKTLIFYKKDGRLPLVWAIENIKSYKKPLLKEVKIKELPDGIKLKPLQEECMKEVDVQFKKDIGGGIINLSTGSGKTVLSLYIISKYRLKTLVIVNTVELMEQWKESIKKFLGNIEVGVIRGDRFDRNTPITIGMLQTISKRKEYTRSLFEDFSLCFIDECHHLSSEVFSEALFKCRAKYTFGLSATVERKDGLEFVFKYHLGDVIFSDSSHGSKQRSIVDKIIFKGKSSIPKYLFNGNPKISTMITSISEDEERNALIVNTLKGLNDNRRVLVLSDRINQLQILHRKLGGELSGLFIGKTSKEDKITSKTKKILLATYNIASEGFDHPALNTLLFATPRSNIVQSIGRIYRKKHEIEPMIIDIIDDFSIFPYQFKKRLAIYSKHISFENKDKKEQNVCLFD